MKTILFLLLLLPCLIYGQTKVVINSGGGTGSDGSGIIQSGNQYRIPYYLDNPTGETIAAAGAITPSRVLVSDANGVPTNSSVTTTTLAFVDPTSSIQTQLNTKASLTGTETLTNKTLTTPIIGSILNGGASQTVPNVTGTLAQFVETSIVSSSTPSPAGNAKFNYYNISNLATNATFVNPSGTVVHNNVLIIVLKGDGTTRNLNWGSLYLGGTDIPLPSSITGTQIYYLTFQFNTFPVTDVWVLVGSTVI